MKGMESRVFVTSGSSAPALAIVRSLGNRGIESIVGDINWLTAAGFSKHAKYRVVYPDPADQEAFITCLINACQALQCNIIFPVTNRSLPAVAQYRSQLEHAGISVPVPEQRTLIKAIDKAQTIEIAERIQIPCPETCMIREEIASFAHRVGFPLVIKPRTGWGAASVAFVKTARELSTQYQTISSIFDKPLVQEYIPGTKGNVYSVTAIFNKQHEVKASITTRKIRENPPSGGGCVFGITTPPNEATRYGLQLLSELKWYGVATVEFKIDSRDGKPKLMEINPRFLGYTQLVVAAGIDLPYVLYQIAKGEAVDTISRYRVGVKWVRLWEDLLTFLRPPLPNLWNTWSRIESYNKALEFDFLSRTDPLPSCVIIPHLIAKKLGIIKRDMAVHQYQV
jgi:predicted ATP-grasp superfamily ATP-dependent carboligase